MAHINVFVDKDGKARKLPVGLPDEKGYYIPAFSVALANLVLDDNEKVSEMKRLDNGCAGMNVMPTNERNQVTTEFFTLPRQKVDATTGYEMLSFVDVMNSKNPLPLKGSIVLVGPFVTAMQDEYPTPISSVKMFGIEIHANMIQTLLESKFYKDD